MARDISAYINQIKQTSDVFEKARLMEFLRNEEDIRPVEIARALDMKPALVAHYLRINRLPIIVVDGYYAEMVSTSHLFIISRLPDHQTMIEVYEKVLEQGMSSSQTEELVREMLYQIKDDGSARLTRHEITGMEREIARSLGDAEVDIVQSRVRAKVCIELPGGVTQTSRIIRKIHRKLSEKTYESLE